MSTTTPLSGARRSPDRLEREPGIDQPLDGAVAQGVRARAGNVDPGAQQVTPVADA
jgi:hypothetical protein